MGKSTNIASLLQFHTPKPHVSTRGQWDRCFGNAPETVDGVDDATMAQVHCHQQLERFACGMPGWRTASKRGGGGGGWYFPHRCDFSVHVPSFAECTEATASKCVTPTAVQPFWGL